MNMYKLLRASKPPVDLLSESEVTEWLFENFKDLEDRRRFPYSWRLQQKRAIRFLNKHGAVLNISTDYVYIARYASLRQIVSCAADYLSHPFALITTVYIAPLALIVLVSILTAFFSAKTIAYFAFLGILLLIAFVAAVSKDD